jgi:hypothetical protein
MKNKGLFLGLIVFAVIIIAVVVSIYLFKDSDLTQKYVGSEGEYVNLSGVDECFENWECSDWGPCINYFRKRVCVDKNACTEILSEIEREVCSSSGKNEYKSEESFNFPSIEENSFFDCGFGEEIYVNDCFVNASINCDYSKFLNEVSLERFGAIIKTNSLLKLKKEGEKCILYEETQGLALAYGEDLIVELLDQGYTQEEIHEEIRVSNEGLQDYLGVWVECTFEKEDLTSVLEEWAIGNLESSADCNFNEQGEFFCEYEGKFANADCGEGFN